MTDNLIKRDQVISLFSNRKPSWLPSAVNLLISFLCIVILYTGWGRYVYDLIAGNAFVQSFKPTDSRTIGVSCLLLCGIIIWSEFRYFVIRKGHFSAFSLTLVLSVLYIWADCLTNDEWIFLHCTLFGINIAYFNLAALCCACALLLRPLSLFRIHRKRPTETNEEPSLLDLPISTWKADRLKRTVFAEQLAKQIRNVDVSDGSVAIAVVSPWGNGKSSFINLIKEQFDLQGDSRHVLLDFSPWSYARGADITRVFFEQLIIATNPFDVTLSKYLRQYIAVLTTVNQSAYDSLINTWRQENERDMQQLYRQVHEELSKSGKTYVVVIDDIDRLERAEILEVLKIVRGSAGFPNIKFICAFDKEYITKVLAHESSAITDRYLEKFFQIEYWLPAYDKDELRNLVLEYASFLSPEENKQMRDYLFSERASIFGRNMDPLSNGISNIRMVRRWVSAIEISYRRLRNEVLITNLADLELIKLTSPSFFEFFRNNWQTFTESDRNHIKLYNPKEENKSGKDDFIASLFDQHKKDLFETENFKSLSELQQTQIKNILSRLIPDYGGGTDKAFSNRIYIERYFFNALQDSEISDIDFNEIMSLPTEQIITTISSPKFAIKAISFAIHIENYKVTDLENVQKYIRTVFAAGRLLPGFMINGMDFMKQLYDFRRHKDEINRWLHEAVIENRGSEFSLRIFQVILHVTPSKYYTPFFDEEMEYTVAEQLFGYALEDNLTFETISRYYWETVKHQNDWSNGKRREISIHSEHSKRLYRQYWEKNIACLHKRLYYKPHGVDADENYYQLNDIAFTLWGDNLNGLIEALHDLDSDPDVKETIRFIGTVLAAEDRTKAINFEFANP